MTGATGFIGSRCLTFLVKNGYQVYGVSSKNVQKLQENVQWRKVNLLDSLQVKALLNEIRPSHLLHFAWYLVPGRYSGAVENLFWLQSSLQLFHQFYKFGGRRIVTAGTCFEYDWSYGFCSESLTPIKPDTLYGTCKAALFNILNKYSENNDLSTACGRIFFVYGPREHPKRLVSSIIISLLRNQPAPCTHGKQMRDFLHVDDVAAGFVALLESDVQGPVNIASGIPVTVRDLANLIGKKISKENLIQLGAISLSKDEAPIVVADTTRLKSEIGWKPKYSLNEGLDDSIRWWKEAINRNGE